MNTGLLYNSSLKRNCKVMSEITAPLLGLIKIGLGPVLLAQGQWVRRSTPQLPEAAGPRLGTVAIAGDAAPLRMLIVGDSSAAGVGVDTQDQALAPPAAKLISRRFKMPVEWQLIARSGVNTREAIDLVASHELRPADLLVTALGVNDVTGQRAPRQFLRDYQALVSQLIKRVGARAVIVTGLPPMHILPPAPQPLRWYLGQCAHRLDEKLQHWVRESPRFAYVSLKWAAKPKDMARDGFHPGANQYRYWAQLVAASAESLWQAGVGELRVPI
jgi:lysophospholipase L1-like esterase